MITAQQAREDFMEAFPDKNNQEAFEKLNVPELAARLNDAEICQLYEIVHAISEKNSAEIRKCVYSSSLAAVDVAKRLLEAVTTPA